MKTITNKSKIYLIFILIAILVFIIHLLFFFNGYPNALEDLAINQLLVPIKRDPIRSHQFPLKDGRNIMKKSSVTIIGVGKDIETTLPTFLKQLEELTKSFKWSQVIFVAGDSFDNTMNILNTWANVKNSVFNRTVLNVDCSNLFDTIGNFAGQELPREGKIAYARNAALNEMYRRNIITDYIIIIDMDILGWNPYGIVDSFAKSEHWDIACSNGVILYGLYRDIYAFRAPSINTNHHLCGSDHLIYNISNEEQVANRHIQVESKKKVHRIMEQVGEKKRMHGALIKLDSCFGGLAIFKSDAIQGCKYQHRYEKPPYLLDCEHVLFNKCNIEKNKARIVTNTNMKLWYGHTSLAAGVDWIKLYNSLVKFH